MIGQTFEGGADHGAFLKDTPVFHHVLGRPKCRAQKRAKEVK